MYRALGHQCQIHGVTGQVSSDDFKCAHHYLRKQAALEIQRQRSIFAPFIVDADNPMSEDEQVDAYVSGVLGTEWGSQIELQALAEVLQVHIQVSLNLRADIRAKPEHP